MTKWHEDFLNRVKHSIEAANSEYDLARYMSEGGSNAGLRSIYGKRALWLSDLIKAAKEHVKSQEFTGNFIPCIPGGDVWFFCSHCGFVIANTRYSADYEDIGIKPYDLNTDMEVEYCPHCGQWQIKYFDKNEETALRKKWKNEEL